MAISAAGAASGAAAGSAFGPWGALIGGVAGAFLGGGKSSAPAVSYQPVDLQAEQSQSIAGNAANESSIEDLVKQGNTFNQSQANSMMEQALPGWGNLQKNLTSTANSLLTNPYSVPQDVQDNLARIASERGISAGTRGQFNDFSLLRDLGVNELQYGQSRINQASSLTSLLASTAPRVNPMSPMSFYTTPQQYSQNQQYTNTQQQGIFQGAANAQTAAGNFNQQNTWNSLTQAATLLGHNLMNPSGSTAGVGSPTSYSDFLAANPYSSAAIGQ